jgi:hypothetical protein
LKNLKTAFMGDIKPWSSCHHRHRRRRYRRHRRGWSKVKKKLNQCEKLNVSKEKKKRGARY